MKVVLITGASSGVGAAAARLFAREGAQVVLVARSTDRLRSLASEIGDQAHPITCDAADPEAVDAMTEQLQTRFGAPDVLINSAGAGQWKTLQDTTPQEAREMMNAPYFAAFHTTRNVLPGMLRRKSGTILHVNSPACITPWPSSVGYAAARAALRALHDGLAQDLVGTGVHSCNVIFGRISSSYFDNNPGTADRLPAIDRLLPTLTPEDCAERLLHLAYAPRHTAIHPFALRALIAFGRLTPPLTRWLVRQ